MPSIQKIKNKKGASYRVIIRKKGIKPITKTFKLRQHASEFIGGSKITVPKFGEYRFVGNQNKADWYLMPGKEKEGRYNFVKVMTNNNNDSRSVTFSIKKGANPLQMQGQCSIKN